MIKIKLFETKETIPWFKNDSKWPRWLRYLEWLIRINVFRQPSYFIDVWRLDELEHAECYHGIDLEEELVKALTEEIQKEIEKNGSYTWEERCEMDKNDR